MDGPHDPGSARSLPAVTVVCRSLGLLAAEAASVGLFAWTVRAWSRLDPYVSANVLTPVGRKFVFLNMGGCVAATLLAALVLLVWKRGLGVELLRRVSHRCAPLALVGVVPLLLRWELWTIHTLTFLVLAGAFALSLQGLVRLSLTTQPVFLGWRAPPPIRALRASLAAAAEVRFLPVAIVLIAAAYYAAFFSFHTIAHHHNLGTAGFDMAIENNLLWNAIHWGPLFKTSPLFGPESTHLGYHQTYFAYFIGIFYRLSPRPETLLVFQAILLGGTALPLYLVARRRIGRWLACLVAVLYIFYPPLHGANLYDFHYLPFAPFFLWLSLYFLQERRDGWAAVAIVFTLSVREDVSALLAVLGMFLVLTGERPRAGLVVAAVGAVYFVVVKMIVMPRFLGGASSYVHQYRALLPEGDAGFGGILKTTLGNPGFTLTTLLEKDKLVYLLQIICPLAFLPWRRPIGLLCSVPGFFFTLLSTGYPPQIQISFQYTAYWTSFLFLGLVANLAWMGPAAPGAAPAGPGRVSGPASRPAWVVALVGSMLVTSNQFGALIQQNTARGGFGPYRFGTTNEDRVRYRDLNVLIGMVPPLAKIAATEMLVAHVSSRPDAYTLRTGLYDAEYLLFPFSPGGRERTLILEGLKSGAFGVVESKGDFALARRGHATARNAEILGKLGD